MRHVVLFFAVILMAAGLGGCIRVNTRIAVKKDGSGTVTERVLMNAPLLKTMASSSKEGKNGSPGSMPERKSLEKNAAAMGEGVGLKGVRAFSEDGFEGYEAVYVFRDISKVRVSGRPDEKGTADSLRAAGAAATEGDRISFRFIKGMPSRLVIMLPEERSLIDPVKKKDAPAQQPSPEQEKLSLAIIREMFRGTRMTLDIEVEGTVLSTDASCRDAVGRIVLADVDFNRLLDAGNDKAMLMLTGSGSTSGSGKELINRVPGIAGETKKQVSVVFQ